MYNVLDPLEEFFRDSNAQTAVASNTDIPNPASVTLSRRNPDAEKSASNSASVRSLPLRSASMKISSILIQLGFESFGTMASTNNSFAFDGAALRTARKISVDL